MWVPFLVLTGFLEKFAYDVFTVTIYLWVLLPLKYLLHEEEVIKNPDGVREGNRFNIVFWLFTFAMGSLVISLRYLILPTVQGYDTPFYIDWATELIHGSANVSGLLGRIFSVLLTSLFIGVLGNPYLGIIALNIFLAGLNVSGVFLLVNRIKGKNLALLASLLTATSFFFHRLYLDLIANQTAWALAPYVLYFYYIYFHENESNTLNLVLFVLLSVVMVLSHIWSAGVAIVVMILDYIFFVDKTSVTLLSNRVILYFAIAFIVPLAIISIFSPNTLFGLINLFIGGWGRGVFLREMFVNRENIVLLLLALIGAYHISTDTRRSDSLFYTLYALISFLLITGFYAQPYRLNNLMPWGILAAYGFEKIDILWGEVVHRFKFKITTYKLTEKIMPIFLLFLVILATPSPFIADHVATPSDKALKQLEWVRDRFGYQNDSIVLLVNKDVKPRNGLGWCNYYRWISAIVGDNYYSGSLMDFVQGMYRVKYSNWVTERYYKGYLLPPPNIKYIVILDEWYDISSLEKSFLEDAGNGIYIIEASSISYEKLLNSLEESYLKLEFKDIYFQIYANDSYEWTIKKGDVVNLSLSTTNNNTPLVVEIPILSLSNLKGEGFVSFKLVSSNNTTAIDFLGETVGGEIVLSNYTAKTGEGIYTLHTTKFEDLLRIKILLYPPINETFSVSFSNIYIYR